MTETYTGPVVYVAPGHAEVADGRVLDGGWHYTAVVDTEAKSLAVEHAKQSVAFWTKRAQGPGKYAKERLADAKDHLAAVEAASWEVPGEKLAFDAKSGTYSLAKPGAKSHHEKHHKQLAIVAGSGSIGDPRDAESIEATKRHLDERLARLASEGPDPHEDGHVLMNPDEISAAKQWLDRKAGS